MKFAGRMNSFIHKGDVDIFQTIEKYRNMKGITHLEFNYPEHIAPNDMQKLIDCIGDMKVNGVATRFKNHFVAGEFTNPNQDICRDAVQLCKDAVDACVQLHGEVLTVWLGFDGFDYAFQIDYEEKWNATIKAYQEVADYANEKGIKVSIEYKPFEPRAFSMIDGIGLTLLALQEINRPNVGVTLDFCHMLMKNESPAYSLALAARNGKLFGLHMNDGYRVMDSGLIFGSVNTPQALEFVYYLKKYNYDGVVFFDSFPFREDAQKEIEMNIEMFNRLSQTVDKIGMDKIAEVVAKQDGVASQGLILEMLK
ncbi:sugar phosphate isomerase/epimerase family protein [Youxingia wuxianensis]|uniref:Xylose isomerase n=1 Tax=Youxingia wuxianensis TaxID=2763678 RepID=A0A926IHI8_9FIRM|nr:sugar phosphate isomerase/epimerase family protein [Youxingia wuxianensis]MBC8585180.1 TIM barrel protein [Youxingia wuxianensis]